MRTITAVTIVLTIFASCGPTSNSSSQDKVLNPEIKVNDELTTGYNSQSQNTFTIETLDNNLILKSLFDCKVLDSRNEAIWEPHFYDLNSELPISDDNKCHTSIDTIIYFISNNVKYALFVFGTHKYSVEEREIIPFAYPFTSLAIFRQKENMNWELRKFDKYFSLNNQGLDTYTENVSISVFEIGKENYVLSFHSQPTGGQGYLEGYLTYYSLRDFDCFRNIFSVMDYYTNSAAVEPSEAYTEEMIQVPIIFSKADYSDVEFIEKRDNPTKSDRITYKYSEECRRYIRDR